MLITPQVRLGPSRGLIHGPFNRRQREGMSSQEEQTVVGTLRRDKLQRRGVAPWRRYSGGKSIMEDTEAELRLPMI